MNDALIILLLVAAQGISYWFQKRKEEEERRLAEEQMQENTEDSSLYEVFDAEADLVARRGENVGESPSEKLPLDNGMKDMIEQEWLTSSEEFLEEDEEAVDAVLKKKMLGLSPQHVIATSKTSTRSNLKQAIIWAEILGPCRAHRRKRG